MNICVIGTGYVGLVTGTCFSEMGNTVWCIDNNKQKIACLMRGEIPIYEPGLQELVQRNQSEGRLLFSADLAEGIRNADICFIAVGTPSRPDGSADMEAYYKVLSGIAACADKYLVIVNKSTVPIGTGRRVQQLFGELLRENGNEVPYDIVSNPEFLKEGTAVDDFMRPDRIVIGCESDDAYRMIYQLYEPFVRNQHPILKMDITSAEITKYASNAMLATKISFMNELAGLCDAVGGDIQAVRVGMGNDQRIGMHFLYAGTGYGGSCFPKDVRELVATGRKNQVDMSIVSSVDQVNEKQKRYLIGKMDRRYASEGFKGKVVGIWGLAFKPMTDDIREAPAIDVIRELLARGARIRAYDPVAMGNMMAVFPADPDRLLYCHDMMDAIEGIDALLLLTEWRQFRQPDFHEMKKRMKHAVIFDGRNQYDRKRLEEAGFEYHCIGRGYHG